MKNFKLIFRLILGLTVGIGIGYLVGLLIGVLFSGESLSVIPQKLGEFSLDEDVADILILIVALLVVIPIQIILHEAGHLAFGSLSGYRFVSFRAKADNYLMRGEVKMDLALMEKKLGDKVANSN